MKAQTHSGLIHEIGSKSLPYHSKKQKESDKRYVFNYFHFACYLSNLIKMLEREKYNH